jgi:hypothetical protein
MRILAALLSSCLTVGTVGCSDQMSLEQARNAAVVTVEGATLDGATLERVLLTTPPGAPGPSRETATIVLSAFIDAALVRNALEKGVDFTDSAMVHDAIYPDAIRGQILTALQERAAAMPPVTDAQADSLARLGGVRVFQHILFRVEDFSDTAKVRPIAQRANNVLMELRTPGADFDAIARRESQDTLTARSGGYLPAMTRRDLPQGRIADVAWALSVGDISGLVPSPAGIHILRRSPLVDAREGFRQWLRPVLTRIADSLWVDSLAAARRLNIATDAVPRLRQLGVEPYSGGGDAPFASWMGGELTADETRTWLSVMPTSERAAMPFAPDSVLILFIEQLAKRDIVAEATIPGARVSPQAWEMLAPQYRALVTAIIDDYRQFILDGDPSETLRNYIVSVSNGERNYRPLPGGLAGVLRRGAAVEVDQRAVDAIVTSAARQWQLNQGIDSTAVPPDAFEPEGDSTPE